MEGRKLGILNFSKENCKLSNMSFKFDLFSTDSYKYSQCRPSYPAEIFDKIVENTPNRKVVVDVGCGTGQACIQLSSYFDRVIGVEPSQNQLEHAIEHYKVDYINAPAENITLSDKRADAITVAAAFHWFDHELFFKEAKRILKEDGTLAVWSYSTNNTFDSEVATQGMYNV
jgi:ubiquinone/menaquinone biosynthesis C-methylase UbiE